MKIARNHVLFGKIEIELTPDELTAAYFEQERIFDLEDVRHYFNEHWKEFHEESTEAQLAYLESNMEKIAAKYREIESGDRRADWWDSAEIAINAILEGMGAQSNLPVRSIVQD